jgi:ABC-type glycerol-3-phosphate transport system permease component
VTVAAKPAPTVPAARLAWYQRKDIRARLGQAVVFLLLLAGAVLFVTPVIWMFLTAIKNNDLTLFQFSLPSVWHWSNFKDAWQEAPFGTYLRNTVIITVVSVTGNVLISGMVAYAFARLRWPGREFFFVLVLATMLLPTLVLFVPQYILWANLHYVDTWVPLTVPAWFGTAFYIFLLRQFFRGIPIDLTDAARVDGAGEFRIWWQIAMPLARPALAAVAIFAFIGAWEDFFNPLIYLSTESKYTLQLGLEVFEASAGGIPQWNFLMAVGFVIMVPVVILFFIGQRYFIEGVTLTGLKG